MGDLHIYFSLKALFVICISLVVALQVTKKQLCKILCKESNTKEFMFVAKNLSDSVVEPKSLKQICYILTPKNKKLIVVRK